MLAVDVVIFVIAFLFFIYIKDKASYAYYFRPGAGRYVTRGPTRQKTTFLGSSVPNREKGSNFKWPKFFVLFIPPLPIRFLNSYPPYGLLSTC